MPGCSLAKRHGFAALRRLVKAAFGVQRCQGVAFERTARNVAARLLALCSPAEVDLLADGAPPCWCPPGEGGRDEPPRPTHASHETRCACANKGASGGHQIERAL